jgi:hypothetical protein
MRFWNCSDCLFFILVLKSKSTLVREINTKSLISQDITWYSCTNSERLELLGGSRAAYPSGATESPPVSSRVHVAKSLVLWIVYFSVALDDDVVCLCAPLICIVRCGNPSL